MRVLLMGGTGFIGAPVTSLLRAESMDVVTLGRSAAADVRLDLLAPGGLEEYLGRERFDAVVNLAGAGLATEAVGPEVMTAVNARLPERALATLLTEPGGTVFIHAGSSTERMSDDEPDESKYSRTKHEGAQAVRRLAARSAAPVVLLRIHNTYGPGQPSTRFVAGTVAALADARPVRLNFPDRVRDFVFVEDVARDIARIVVDPRGHPDPVEIGTGVGTTLNDVALAVADRLGRDRSLVMSTGAVAPDPHPFAVAAAVGGTLGTCRTTLAEGLARIVED